MHRILRTAMAVIVVGLVAAATETALSACTAFCATTNNGAVLVGNNEDWDNPRTKIHFIPATPGTYGRLFVGFDDLRPQGGMNDHGLWFDGFAVSPVRPDMTLPSYRGDIVEDAMAKCATVDEVVRLFSRYNRAFLKKTVLMFADASGDAAAIDANAIVRKRGPHLVQTNFRQSRQSEAPDQRFTTATSMLDHASAMSVDLFRDILAATHQEGGTPTQYSNVYDLHSRTMYLYLFHEYSHVVIIHLDDELKKGERVVDMPSLFPPNAAHEQFAANWEREHRSAVHAIVREAAIVAAAALAALGLTVYAFVRGSRSTKLLMAGAAAAVLAALGLGAFTLRSANHNDIRWLEFSIGPPFGRSVSVQPAALRGEGVTLKTALSIAYDIPAVRISGPDWLASTRYAMTAVADGNDALFRSSLKDELQQRLHLVTHMEPRAYEVFVLRATAATRLQSASRGPAIHVRDDGMDLGGASLADLAGALQPVLGKPTVDETGIAGAYNMQLAWGADRVASVTAELRDRFGLELSDARRTMDTLVVDAVHPDPSLVLLTGIGRATEGAPLPVRRQLARFLAVH
ncbi:MAG: TIGR03435 family protein [Vicinamibacterales bacterium]